MVLVFGIIFIVLFQLVANQTDVNKYGPYKLDWLEINSCSGPKSTDCGSIQLTSADDPSNLLFLTNMPEDCHVQQAKIEVATKQNNSIKKLFHSVINKPCQHFVIGPILKDAYGLNSSCKINKGSYRTYLNLDRTTKTFLGSAFFYGAYYLKTTVFNKKSNIFCANSTVNVLKLP